MEVTIHTLLHQSILLNGAKRSMLRLEKDNLDTVAVGSSHGDFGFDPSFCPGAFNLCCRSQDLKHSLLLYKHISDNYPKIKNLVLFYSTFSPGSVLEKSLTEKFISPSLNELFNLNFEYEDQELASEFDTIRNRLGGMVRLVANFEYER
jgi:hypothetical protein